MLFKKSNPIALLYAGILTSAVTLAYAEAELNPIIVTGSGYEESSQNVPAFVTVITKQQIADSGASSVGEAIMQIAGVAGRQSLSGGNEFSLDLGGFGDTSAQNTAIVVDGIRIKEGDLSETRLSGIPIEQVERIEIQRGASSVLYGEGAVSGVINIITKASSGQKIVPSASVYGSLGSFNTKESRATGNYSNGEMSVSLSGDDRMSDGYRANSANKDQNTQGTIQYKNQSFIAGLNLNADYFYSRNPGALTYAQFLQDPQQSQAQYANDWTRVNSNQYGAFVESELQGITFRLNANQRTREISFSSQGYSSTSNTVADFIDFTGKRNFATPFGNNTLLAGLEYNNWNTSTLTDTSTSQSRSSAYFLKNDATIDAIDSKITAGYRSEAFEKNQTAGTYNSASSLSSAIGAWELGASKLLNESNSVYVKLAKSYRLATTDEFSFTPNGINLVPQTSIDKELGWKYLFDNSGRLGIRVYRSDLNNEIGYDPNIPNLLSWTGLGANVNFDPTRREGVDLDASYKPLTAVTISTKLSFKNAYFVSGVYAGNTIPMAPRETLNLRADWNFAPAQTVGAGWNWVSSQYIAGDFLNQNTMPAYGTVDLKYSYKQKKYEFSVFAKNLMNANYFAYATTTGGYSVYPEFGRSLAASLKINF